MSGRPVVFRLDVTSDIGAGHAMRCLAVARELGRLGAESLFVVSCGESASFLGARGARCTILPADPAELGRRDARELASLCLDEGACALVVDTYGAMREFHAHLGEARDRGVTTLLVDDMYSYERGRRDTPYPMPYDIVLNYAFYADENAYGDAYRGTGTELLLGPAYAPLREEFCGGHRAEPAAGVTDVLVTTGSTNPGRWLERMAGACELALGDCVRVHVVVGPAATFEHSGPRIVEHRGEKSMAGLMARCQLAVSAAGSTLYELGTMGVPAVAVPIVENQILNARWFAVRGLGVNIPGEAFGELAAESIGRLARDPRRREEMSAAGTGLLDGRGARRVANVLYHKGGSNYGFDRVG